MANGVQAQASVGAVGQREASTPLLLLHGMCCTGDVWDGFRGVYEALGLRVVTPTLRPEQRIRKRPPKELGALRFSQYVEDLCEVAAGIAAETGRKPAVIGHSMGGLLAQALAERDQVSAAVLISPSAPAGVRTLRARVLFGAIGVGHVLGLVPRAILPGYPATARTVLNAMPKHERHAAFKSLVHESGRVLVDLASYPIDEQRIKVPVLTIACGRDRLVPADLVRLTGLKYQAVGGELREYAEHGHWLYAEPGWERRATEILDWLEAQGVV